MLNQHFARGNLICIKAGHNAGIQGADNCLGLMLAYRDTNAVLLLF